MRLHSGEPGPAAARSFRDLDDITLRPVTGRSRFAAAHAIMSGGTPMKSDLKAKWSFAIMAIVVAQLADNVMETLR